MFIDDELFRRLCRSRDFIAASLDQPVRLADAARQACMSPFHYHRLFAHTFGETPHQFLTRVRIDRAKELLARDELPVTEVCLAVGYESLGTFSTRFRSVVGHSPAQFQKRLRRIFPLPRTTIYRFVPNCYLLQRGLPTF